MAARRRLLLVAAGLFLVFHVGLQDAVDEGLVRSALLFEPGHDIRIQPDGDGDLGGEQECPSKYGEDNLDFLG